MTTTITVSARLLGRKKPLFADFSVPLPPGVADDDGGMTLRRLIAQIVSHEVQSFRERQEQRRLERVLSAAQIERGVEAGKVDMGGQQLKQEVDEEAAIATALQAFEDGLYLVVIDGQEHRDLDRQVYLQADSRVTFIRLVFLAGA